MALRTNSHVSNRPLSLRRSHDRLGSVDAFSVWPDITYLERDPFVCFADDDDDNKDDKKDDKAKTFTQEDVDRIVQRRLKKEQTEREALAKQVEELTAKLDSKTDDDSEKLSVTKKLEREIERRDAKIAELEKKVTDTEAKSVGQVSRLKAATLDRHALAALTAAGALPGASKHALQAFLADAKGEVEFDEDGSARFIVHVDGVPYEDKGDGAELAKASAKWLASNKHFAKAVDTTTTTDPKKNGPSFESLKGPLVDADLGTLLDVGLGDQK